MERTIDGVIINFEDELSDPVSFSLKQGRNFSRPSVEHTLMALRGKKNAVVWDIGAHVGTYCLYVAASRFRWEVVGIEGSPTNYDFLLKSAKRNAFPNLKIYNYLVGNGDTVGFKDQNSGARVLKGGVATTHRLDDVLEGPVDFIKLDIEGYEPECIKGMEKTLKKYMPQIMIEFNGHTLRLLDHSPNDLLRQLDELGYEVVTFDGYRINKDKPFPFGVTDCMAIRKGDDLHFCKNSNLRDITDQEIEDTIKTVYANFNDHIKQYLDWYIPEFFPYVKYK